jgi:hypothetical protein
VNQWVLLAWLGLVSKISATENRADQWPGKSQKRRGKNKRLAHEAENAGEFSTFVFVSKFFKFFEFSPISIRGVP